jgi:hypothetical protein
VTASLPIPRYARPQTALPQAGYGRSGCLSAIERATRAYAPRRWLEEMLAEPRQEYPEFPAALSHVVMLEPAELAEVLGKRAQRLTEALAALDANAAAEAAHGLPRIATLETEYQRAVLAAEARWVTETVTQLRSGLLTWSPDELRAFAEGR